MQTRTIRAKDVNEALQKTKHMLGPDALIVSTRHLNGVSGPVEMTAIVQDETKRKATIEQKNVAKSDVVENPDLIMNTIEPLREDLTSLRRMVTELRKVTEEAVLPGFNDLRKLILETSAEQEANRFLGPLYSEILDKGVTQELARDLVRTVELELGLEEVGRRDLLSVARGLVLQTLEKNIVVSGPLAPERHNRIFSFIGPSGVGKTTTIAKIASRLVLTEGLDVVMITTDTYRVGSVDHSRRYAELIGIPLVVVDHPSKMNSALRTYASADAMIIDTPGRVFEDDETLHHVKSILESISEPVETHLLMAAAASPIQQEAIGDRFRCLDPNRVLVTKLDETTQTGGVVNAQHLTNLPISYITNGQRVPEDIVHALPRSIARFAVGPVE